tara:strand:- start:298 stop:552 length:255 start_codon:yes stop_codon:yes gene_type:complete
MTQWSMVLKDGLEYEDPNNKSKGYNLINGKRVLNTDEIPFHKGGRPQTKKSMTEDRDDKKLHPLGTFSHGGIVSFAELSLRQFK